MLSEVQTTFDKELFAGQTCTFTNELGVLFPGLTIQYRVMSLQNRDSNKCAFC